MAKSKTSFSGWVQKKKVQLKLAVPIGISLSVGETVVLAEMYQDDVETITENKKELVRAISATNSVSFTRSLEKARGAKAEAIGVLKRTKDPLKRREWARRVVVADRATQSMTATKKRITSTAERLHMLKGDVELELMEAESRAQEAKAYTSAGKQLRLAGQGLIDARRRASKLKMNYDNLEITLEGVEKTVDSRDSGLIMIEAEKVMARYSAGGDSDE